MMAIKVIFTNSNGSAVKKSDGEILLSNEEGIREYFYKTAKDAENDVKEFLSEFPDREAIQRR